MQVRSARIGVSIIFLLAAAASPSQGDDLAGSGTPTLTRNDASMAETSGLVGPRLSPEDFSAVATPGKFSTYRAPGPGTALTPYGPDSASPVPSPEGPAPEPGQTLVCSPSGDASLPPTCELSPESSSRLVPGDSGQGDESAKSGDTASSSSWSRLWNYLSGGSQ